MKIEEVSDQFKRGVKLWGLVYGACLMGIIYSSSGVGYYQSVVYQDYMAQGWSNSAFDPNNSIEYIGTISSLLCVPLAILSFRYIMDPIIKILIYFQLYVLYTAVWSDVLGLTIVDCLKVTMYSIICASYAHRVGFIGIIRVFAISSLIISSLSIVVSVVDPVFRTTIGADGWRGLFVHKNTLGAFCLFSIIQLWPGVFFKKSRKWSLIGMIPTFIAIGLSQSKTSIVLSALYISITSIIAKRGFLVNKKRMQKISFSMGIILLISVMTILLALMYGLTTFTGRSSTWYSVVNILGNSYLFGFGGRSASFDPRIFIPIDSSYVATVVNIGVVGLLLYVYVVRYFWKSSVCAQNSMSIFSIVGLLAYIIYGVTESGAQLRPSIATVVIILQAVLARENIKKIRVDGIND